MAETLLQNRFVEELLKIYPRKTELSIILSDILKIERESAIRRIYGKVNFSINEMGIVAKKLNISIDQLLHKDSGLSVLPWRFCHPNGMISMDDYLNMVNPYVKKLKNTNSKSIEMGAIFHSFPLEFIIPYPSLYKFYYFKLGRYNFDSAKFADYSTWQMPTTILEFLKDINLLKNRIHKAFYIWNYQTTNTWMDDLTHFYKMDIISMNDVESMKNELHELLNEIEIRAGRNKIFTTDDLELNLYISRLDLGISYVYHNSLNTDECNCFMRSLFSFSFTSGNNSMNIRSWIRSMRSVCTLISGTGEPERVMFFKEQHKIIDNKTF